MTITDYKGKTLVALSGGADSVALLCMLHGQGDDIEALHCNFQLRGEESERDEHFVTDLCHRLGIPLHVKRFDTQYYAREQGISIEMAARTLRYEWFETMRQKLGATAIAVAHHREDQAETLLLNLVRGTGLRGLAGMRPRNGHIIRPLLDMSKEEILDYLKHIGQDYMTDSTNLEREALRNRIRLDIMPLLRQLNPKAVEHIAETAEKVADAIPYYMKGVDLSDDLTATTLHERLSGCGFNATQETCMLTAIRQRQSGKEFISPTHQVLIDRGKLILQDCTNKPSQTVKLHIQIKEPDYPLKWLKAQNLTPDCAFLDADKVNAPLALRHPQAGDRFQPFGMGGRSRLISDFLTDHKLSLLEKQHQWLVTMGEEIVWVCRMRPDHRFRVTEATRRIMVLSLQGVKSQLSQPQEEELG